jgi:Ca-activated chloride channel homolog
MVSRSTRASRGVLPALPVLLALALALGACVADSSKDAGSAAGNPHAPLPPAATPGSADGPANAGAPGAEYAEGDEERGSGFAPEIDPARQPLSTFAVDVDTASYGYTRRQLTDGRRPDPTSVRPEEFVNTFRQDYREPGGDGFAVSVDGARAPGGSDEGEDAGPLSVMRIGLQTRAEDPRRRPDAVLTFVVDVSGSMGQPGKLDLVQDALHTLVDQLRPSDRVAIVSYSDDARVVREMAGAGDRGALHAAIDRLRIEGSTNLEAGLVLGYEVARAGLRAGSTNRVILLSDGLPNVGNTSAEPILRQVREAAAKKIALLGVGVGSDYGDSFMEELADKGDGFVVYVSDNAQARRVFVEQLPATIAVRALDAKTQVEFNPSVVSRYRLIGYDNRALSASAFRNDAVDGGEVGPGHSVTALYAVRLRAGHGARATVATVRVRWLDPNRREPSETSATVTADALGGQFEQAAPRLRMCYAAAYFAESLRGSPYGRDVRLADLAAVADSAAAATEDADVRELAGLIRRAQQLGR